MPYYSKTYYKAISSDMCNNDYKYKEGLNVDDKEFIVDPDYPCHHGGGIYFTDIENIFNYANDHRTLICEVHIPEGNPIVRVFNKCRTNSVYLKVIGEISDLSVVKYLHENGADITANDNSLVRWAADGGYLNIVEYLHKNGADITADSNYAIRWAAQNGHLEVVKYLYKNGADGGYGLGCAAEHGHLNIVKYLHENGVNVTTKNRHAIRWAANREHLDVVKYLHENGASLQMIDSGCIMDINGRTEIIKYMEKNGVYIPPTVSESDTVITTSYPEVENTYPEFKYLIQQIDPDDMILVTDQDDKGEEE